jgi:hypothetical protein
MNPSGSDRICQKCGANVPEGDKYCAKCGVFYTPRVPFTPMQDKPQKPWWKSSWLTAICVIVIAFVFFMGIMNVFFHIDIFHDLSCSNGSISETGTSPTVKTDTTTKTTTTPATSPLQILGYSDAQSAILNQNFVRQLPASGGLPPYTWTLVSGNLPTGLTLNSKGQITGTPTSTGSFTYILKLTDARGKSVETDYSQKVAESGTLRFAISISQYLSYNENQMIAYVPFVQGGKQPWTFTISGLPAGLTYDPSTGLIWGKTSTTDVLPITISLKDADGNEATGSPVMVSYMVSPPTPTNVASGKSVYADTYGGIFAYSYEDDSNPPKTIPGGFRLTIKLADAGTIGGETMFKITYARCSDPYFGCQMGCTPNEGSFVLLPAEPPTSPSNPSAEAMGIHIIFPNGTILYTDPRAGALSVSYSGMVLSNSLDPEIQNETWVALGANQYFLPHATKIRYTSWSLSWSFSLD